MNEKRLWDDGSARPHIVNVGKEQFNISHGEGQLILVKLLMNYGFIICEDATQFKLMNLWNTQYDLSEGYNCFENALKGAANFINKEKEKWTVQLTYFIPLGRKFKDLDMIIGYDYVNANEIAQEMAAKYLKDNEIKAESWQVNIRPFEQ
jgi:hypothetical protein